MKTKLIGSDDNTTGFAVLRFVADYTEAQGYPPTIREISDYFHWASSNAAMYHIRRLQKAGLVNPQAGRRTLTLTDDGRSALGG